MDTLLSPGLSTYSTQQGAEYRISGVVRGSLTDADAQTALQALGLASLTYYGAGSTLPTDWPVENLPALGTNERYFHADGIWMQSSDMPTAYTATNGASLVFYQVWQHNANIQPVTLTSNSGVTIPGTSTSNNWWIAGAVISIAAAGGLAYAAWKSEHVSHTGARENPLTNQELYTVVLAVIPRNSTTTHVEAEVISTYNTKDDALKRLKIEQNKFVGLDASGMAYAIIKVKSPPARGSIVTVPIKGRKFSIDDYGNMHVRKNPLYQENYLRHVNGRWALVSKTTGRPLAYYRGSGKPSQVWVSKQERRVQYFKYNKNPVQYHSSFKVHGVPVHMHIQDGKFCADYRAVDRFAPGKGGIVCGRTEADAEDRARDVVAAALIQAKRLIGTTPKKPKLYPSPWDEASDTDDENSLEDFAFLVKKVANEIQGPPERFGRKVFIAAIIDRAREKDMVIGDYTDAQFKDLLVKAHRAGLLSLSRADLGPAMDINLLRRSETRYMNAEFHFVNV